jgi:hypothetical protein
MVMLAGLVGGGALVYGSVGDDEINSGMLYGGCGVMVGGPLVGLALASVGDRVTLTVTPTAPSVALRRTDESTVAASPVAANAGTPQGVTLNGTF